MPNPNDKTKQSGDTHPPELEDNAPAAADEPEQDEATPGRGENQAGFVKDRDLSGGSEGERR
jgi:hypothetical protein